MFLEDLKRRLKAEAERVGFTACGVSEAKRLDDEAYRLEQWLASGLHGTMDWMATTFEKRIDPTRLVEGARSVISLIDTYYQPQHRHPDQEGVGRISRYAWGDDYHMVMKEKLLKLFSWLGEQVDDLNGRVFVDSAPVMDKVWAQRSGLGWIGKNTNLISRSAGSFFFLAEMVVNIPLEPDPPGLDFCGSCTRCLDACPTDALYEPYVIDSNRCISYLTIEHREDDIPKTLSSQFGGWIFGCDICQDVCPWNKFARETADPRYLPREGMVDTDLRLWMELEPDEFRSRFRNSPVKRARFEGFRRNIRLALEARSGPASA